MVLHDWHEMKDDWHEILDVLKNNQGKIDVNCSS